MTSIKQRKLTSNEILILEEETKKFPDLGYISRDTWSKFDDIYVMMDRNSLIGFCVAIHLNRWIKLGPVIILEKYQGKGQGRKLLQFVIEKLQNNNLYIGSSNPRMHKIIRELGFKRVRGFFHLPMEIKKYLLNYIIQRLSLIFIWYEIKKRITQKRNEYHYYIKLLQ